MRIACVSQFYSPVQFGGAEVSTQHLCEALVKRGHDVHVITTRLPTSNESERINRVNVKRVEWGNIYAWHGQAKAAVVRGAWHAIDVWNPMARLRVAEWLKEIEPDIFHTNTLAGISCSVWGIARRMRIPIVHTLRDYYLLCPRSSMFKDGQNCMQKCVACAGFSLPKRRMSQQVIGVVGNSEFILNRHLGAGFFSKSSVTSVIRNIAGIPADPRSNLRNSAGSHLRVGFLGRLDPSKGVETLLKAVKNIGPAKVTLQVAGRGDKRYEEALKSSATTSNIQFTGHVNAEAFLKGLDVLVVPSLWHDPLPRVIFEAYASGVPVICSDTGGSREIVRNGLSGFVFKAGDALALEGLLLRIADEGSLLKVLRQGSTEMVSSFTSDVVAGAYERVYAQVSGH